MNNFDHLKKFEADDAPAVLPDAKEKPVFAAAARPRSDVREEGVIWRGPWEGVADGTSVATRLHVLALEKAGVAVKLFAPGAFLDPLPGRPGGPGTLDPMVVAQVGHLRQTEIGRITASVHHLLPTYDALRQALYPMGTDSGDREMIEATHARKVLLTVLERDRVEPRIMELVIRFGQVWVPCRRNRDVLVRSGADPERVHVVPHPYDEASPMLAIRETPMVPGPMNFLALGKWEPRKNLDAVIGGFMLSHACPKHAPADYWRLIVKTSGFARVPGYPESATASVRKWLEDERVKSNGWTAENVADRILIIQNTLSYQDIVRLYRGAHRFVTASHGEAFDLPAFDAVMAGIPLIHTGFGGSEDYATGQRIWKGEDGLEDVHPMYKWTKAKWARVTAEMVRDQFDLLGMTSGDLMRRAKTDMGAYSPTRVGRQMADLLARL